MTVLAPKPYFLPKWVLINLSNPLRHPVPLVDPLLTKNLDTAGPWCDFEIAVFNWLCLFVLNFIIFNQIFLETALPIATSTLLTEASRYFQWVLYYYRLFCHSSHVR